MKIIARLLGLMDDHFKVAVSIQIAKRGISHPVSRKALHGNGMVVLLPGRNLGGLLLIIPIIANQKIVGSIRSAVGIVANPGNIADSQLVQGVPGILRVNTDKMKGDFGAIFFLTIAN